MKTNIEKLREYFKQYKDPREVNFAVDKTCEALLKDVEGLEGWYDQCCLNTINEIKQLLKGGVKCRNLVPETETLCGDAIDEDAPYPAYCPKCRKKGVKG